jgi:hypothetical protein
MIDMSREALLSMSQAARVRPLGRLGRPTHPSTVYRWISRGVRGRKLESLRLGGTLYTSREALQRFADLLTGETAPTPAPSPATLASLKAEEELRRFGF